MRTSLVTRACPGFGLRMCLSCKRPWISSASEDCIIINRYCPQCIPLISETVKDWQLDARYGPLPDRRVVEERIQRRRRDRRIEVAMAKAREERESEIKRKLEEIERARRSA